MLQFPLGDVVIDLYDEGEAAKICESFTRLCARKYYHGCLVYQVQSGCLAQTGDPTGTGMGGSFKPDVEAEFTDKESFTRGAVGMARSSDPDSANSQFFICFDDASFLDENYTLFGRVVEGMEYVDNITPGEPPSNPDKIVKMQVAADAN